MTINSDQLSAHLNNTLSPVYHIHGDELLLQQDVRRAIRHAAQQRGAQSSQTFLITPDIDWQQINSTLSQSGLFAEKEIIDLRHPTGKFDKKSANILVAYCKKPNPDNTLIITTPKLTKAQLNTAFYKTLTQNSTSVKIWPIPLPKLPIWIQQRMRAKGLISDTQSARMLAELTEGNLVATHQAIEKCHLLYPGQRITPAMLETILSNHQHYSIYDLTNAALSGQVQKTLHILSILKQEHTEPVLVLWNIVRELRALLPMAWQVERGLSIAQVTASAWSTQKPLLQSALKRLNYQAIKQLLQTCSQLDQTIKGARPGSFWQLCENLLLQFTHTPIRKKT